MISRITGTLLDLDLKRAIVDVQGVGYKIFVSGETIEYLAGNIKKGVSLHTYLAVRENALDLYGFKDEASLNMIEEDTSYLTKVSGIGKKAAEKIVLELKGKFKGLAGGLGEKKDVSKEALVIDALKSLGYDERSARDAVKKMPKDLTTEEMIKKALREIGN